MDSNTDQIHIQVPFKAEYVSIVRLAVSGIANRMGFDIETIEDMKVAISEVCNRFVSKGSNICSSYRITFEVCSNELKIMFDCDDKTMNCVFDGDPDGLGLSIINALMDHVEKCGNGTFLLMMSKMLEGNFENGSR